MILANFSTSVFFVYCNVKAYFALSAIYYIVTQIAIKAKIFENKVDNLFYGPT